MALGVGLAVGLPGCDRSSLVASREGAAKPQLAASEAVEAAAKRAARRTLPPPRDARTAIDRITAGDASPEAAKALRTFGPEGLAVVLEAYDAAVVAKAPAETLERLSRAADVAAQQRDVVHTRLYWHTDIGEAKRAAAAADKPILSLRMMGNLDEELSCANSRFFRTMLYPNHEVATRMRRDFVLYWSSERPIPVVTIDYGDGRVVKRTVTGNSIHYILDREGEIVDAIPGLYGPARFTRRLDEGGALARLSSKLHYAERTAALRGARERAIDEARRELASRARAVGYRGEAPVPVPFKRVPAIAGAGSGSGKGFGEGPIIRAVAPEVPKEMNPALVPWEKLAAGIRAEVRIDEAARAVMRSKAPLDWTTATPRPVDDAAFASLVDTFEVHVAQDTVRNELYFRATILRWLVERPDLSMRTLNQRVYAELFLTPGTDPWLGLIPPIAYSGLQADGF